MLMLLRRCLLALAAAVGSAPSMVAARQATGRAARPVDPAAILAVTGAPAVAGLVTDADGVIAQVCGGLRRAGGTESVADADPWHIGSNTKAMTAALYARLVEAGQARWGADLASLFPGVTLDPAWSGATIETLLSHRAGISDRPLMAGGWVMLAHADTRPAEVQRAELAGQILAAPPTGKPGRFEYANLNYILAGAAIEALVGTSWEEAMRTRLFEPLGVASAGFGAPRGPAPWGHQGRGLSPVDPAGLADNPPALGPAGTVHMTLADHARFARLFLKDNAILGPDSIRRLTTPTKGETYALGWVVVPGQSWSAGPILAHEGSNTLWHEAILVAPGRGVAIITACNAGPDTSKGAAMRLGQQLQKAYVG